MSNEGPQNQPWPTPYERPNQKWQCGRTESVFPCALGPDGHGRCRTTAECNPVLEKKGNEEKGRFRCTRRAEYGGPCAEGPLPSGACSHPLPPCAPIRSVRSRRSLFTYWVLGLTVAALLLLFHTDIRYQFANPGPISSVHARPKGAQNVRDSIENCAACHRHAGAGLDQWLEAAAGANPGPLHFAAFARPGVETPTGMDAACAQCHRGHQFHHVNMQQEQSCLPCHSEHHGNDGLRVKTVHQCIKCHGDSRRMDEAFGKVVPVVLRGGSDTNLSLIRRFSRDHPEFAAIARKTPDPNTLRFNHQKHLTAPVVGLDGKPLQCSACHREDAAGEYHQRIGFEQHCQSCHSLQFDPDSPDLPLPHGDVEFVKAFLGSLPQQYEQHAQKNRGITERRALREFVDAQMKRIQERQLSGTSLEDGIFLGRNRRLEPSGRIVPFYGCAYCHEVSGNGNSVKVVKAEVPLRWLTKGAFQHREHQNVACTLCHNAAQSTRTSDVLLPSVKTCATCHRSNAAPGESCTVCHSYHHWREQAANSER